MANEKTQLTPEVLFDVKVIERFLNKLTLNPENSCIEWTDTVNPDGYGQISIGSGENQYKVRAHRWALQFALGGVILPQEIMACHHCDNPKCVAPDHLFPGTHQDNMNDMVAKGRSTFTKGNANLDIEQVKDIKYGTLPYSHYMEKYGVAKSTVSYIRNGRSWPEV